MPAAMRLGIAREASCSRSRGQAPNRRFSSSELFAWDGCSSACPRGRATTSCRSFRRVACPGRRNDLASVVRPKGRFDCHGRYLSLPIDRYAKRISGPRHTSVPRTAGPPADEQVARAREGSSMSTTSGSSRTSWSNRQLLRRPIDQLRGTTGHPDGSQPSPPRPPPLPLRLGSSQGSGRSISVAVRGQY